MKTASKARQPRRIKSAAEKAALANRKAHYVGGYRRVIGGVPCRVSMKPIPGSWYTPSNTLPKESLETVRRRENEFCHEQLIEYGIEYTGSPVAAWMEAYPEIRRLRGDAIPVFTDDSMDIDMFTGEATIPANIRQIESEESDARAALVAMGVTPAADPIAQLAAIRECGVTLVDDAPITVDDAPIPVDDAPITVDNGRQTAYGLWIVDMGVRPARNKKNGMDEYGCYAMVHCIPLDNPAAIADPAPVAIVESAPDFATDICVADVMAYWQEQSLSQTGTWDVDWCEAMHDLNMGTSAWKHDAEARKADLAGDVDAKWLAASYAALVRAERCALLAA